MKRSRVRFPLWARCDHVFPAIGTTAGACMTSAPASVDEIRFGGEPAVRVASAELSATFLPDLGLTGVSLRFGRREHLALPGGLPALRAGHTLGIPLLAPWANRLASRRYRAAGVDVDLNGLALGTDTNGLPIHGFLVGRPGWRLGRCWTRGRDAKFRADIDVDEPAFPFTHRIEVAVTARDRALTIETTIVPTASRAVPVAFRWHPYLRLPGSPRRHWKLQLPASTHVELDGHGIPTGAEDAAPAEAEPIGTRTFDDLYRLARGHDLSLVGEGAAITMHAGPGYRFAQVWVPPRRSFAALEPMTSATNSLIDGTAPLVEPGDAYTATFTLRIEEA